MDPITVGILVVSETAFKDPSTDKAIETLTDVFNSPSASNVEWNVKSTRIVPDNIEQIASAIIAWTDLDLIITTGGTGFAVKDVTPEAVRPLLMKEAPGIIFAMLAASLAITPFAMMSRPVAGVRDATLIVTLPGSPKGAKENLEAIIKFLPHACIQAKGGDSRAIHSGGVKKLEKDAGVQDHNISHSHSHSHSHGDGHHGPTPHTAQSNSGHSNQLHGSVTTRHRSSPYPMLSVADANELIAKNTPLGEIIEMPVDILLVGHILAEDVNAAESVPAYRASIVDGYAVIHTDGKGIYPVVSVSHAAPSESKPLQKGQIARITTGAPLPNGATAVVMVEDTSLKKATEDNKEELEVEILAGDMKEGENIREIGSDVMAGDLVLPKGAEITAVGGEIGILASVGAATVQVYRKPVVGVLSTGDEVVEHNRPAALKRGEIRDSNRPTLMAIVNSWGYKVVDLGIASDKPESLQEILTQAMETVDVIVTTGGVSMGELDLLKPTIERSLGGTIHFGRVAMKPGKPTTFATVASSKKQILIFSLPGNPASATVTFHLFVLPSLRLTTGHVSPGHHLRHALVNVAHDIPLDSRPEYHRASVIPGDDGGLLAISTGGQRSSRIGSMTAANALLCLPSMGQVGDKRTKIPGGDKVMAIIIGRL